MDQKGGRAVTRDKRDNFLLFINSKILRERIERGRVYTHMYIGAVFSCTGCSPGSVYEGNSGTRNSRELELGRNLPVGRHNLATRHNFLYYLDFIFHQEVNEQACIYPYAYIRSRCVVVSVV